MSASDSEAHGQLSKAVNFCSSALARVRLRRFALVVRQYRPLASGAERLRWGGPPKAVGSPMRLHCTAAWSRPGARPFSPLRAPWALGRAAPGGRSVSVGTGAVRPPPPAAPGCGSSRASPRLRPCVPLGRFGSPSPAGPRLCGRWSGPGALGSRGAGGCAPFRFPAPSFRLAPSGCFPRPLCRLPRCFRGCQFSLPPPPPLPPRWGSRGARGLRPWGLPPPLRSPCSCVCFRRRPRGWCFLRRYAGRGQFYQGGSGFRA